MNNPQNMRGTKVAPPAGPGSFIGKAWRQLIVNTVNCFWNPTIKIKTLAPDGTQSIMTDTPIEMGPMGWVATIDLTSIVGAAATSTVPFSGAGAPSSSTLSSSYSYVAGATPSLYVDTTNKRLYYCSTAGTNSTSVWTMITTNVPFSGAGAPASGTLSSSFAYVAGTTPSLYIDTTNRLLYYCTTAGTNSTSVWASVISSSGATQFVITSDGGDYWNCYQWDGSSITGSPTKVAKPYKIRTGVGAIASEIIGVITYTYSYSSGQRSVSGSDGTVEVNDIVPPVGAYYTDIIYAIPFSTNAPSSLVGVAWIDINADGRVWAS